MLRVIDGKGGKNREVPMAPRMIERASRVIGVFIAMRSGSSLVSAAAGKSDSRALQAAMAAAREPMSVSSVQAALRVVVPAAQDQEECHLS